MTDAGDPTVAPRPAALVTSAVAAVGVLALALAGTSPAPALGAVSGGVLAVGLRRFDRSSVADLARGVALVAASALVGAFVIVAAQAPGAADVTLSLAALLWLAALGGVGAGRGALDRSSLDAGALVAFATFLALGLLVPVFGGLALAAAAAAVALRWNVATPALGTVLALYGVAILVVGVVLGATPASPDARRPINRQLRRRSTAAKRLGRRLLGTAGIVGAAGVLFGYELLRAVAPPLWRALAFATGNPLVRGAPVAAAGLAALAYAGRGLLSWLLDDDDPDPARVAVALSAVAAAALAPLVALVAALLVRLSAVGAPALGERGVVGWTAVWGGLGVALFVPAAVLFVLRGVTRESDRRTAVGPYVCAGALLLAAVVVALRGSGVVAPLVGVGAATAVWDVGRVGSTMGVELGAEATVRRGALVRAGGSVAVGTLATVVAVAMAVGVRRVGDLVGQFVGGPVVLAIGAAVGLVAVLALYARRRASST